MDEATPTSGSYVLVSSQKVSKTDEGGKLVKSMSIGQTRADATDSLRIEQSMGLQKEVTWRFFKFCRKH